MVDSQQILPARTIRHSARASPTALTVTVSGIQVVVTKHGFHVVNSTGGNTGLRAVAFKFMARTTATGALSVKPPPRTSVEAKAFGATRYNTGLPAIDVGECLLVISAPPLKDRDRVCPLRWGK